MADRIFLFHFLSKHDKPHLSQVQNIVYVQNEDIIETHSVRQTIFYLYFYHFGLVTIIVRLCNRAFSVKTFALELSLLVASFNIFLSILAKTE